MFIIAIMRVTTVMQDGLASLVPNIITKLSAKLALVCKVGCVFFFLHSI